LHWLQDPREINGYNLNNVKCEASRHFRNKKREYPKDRIKELAMTSTNKNIRDLYRGINEFKRDYQPRSNSAIESACRFLLIFSSCRNYFSQLLNVHSVNDCRQTEIRTTEPLVPDPSRFETETGTANEKV
jgi:hypothetical protein